MDNPIPLVSNGHTDDLNRRIVNYEHHHKQLVGGFGRVRSQKPKPR